MATHGWTGSTSPSPPTFHKFITVLFVFYFLLNALMRHDEHSHNHDVAQETSRVPYLFLDDRLITDEQSGSSPSSNTQGNGSTTDTLQCSYCTRLLTEQCTVYTHDCWRLTDGWMAGGRAGAQGRGRGKGVVGSHDKRGGLGALIRQRHVFGLDLR